LAVPGDSTLNCFCDNFLERRKLLWRTTKQNLTPGLSLFCIYGVILNTADVVSDFYNGADLINRDQIRLGLVTIFLVFVPFLAR